jgi:TatD DNase family protein
MVSGLKKVVFHCYGGGLPTMKQAVDKGFYISLATVICKSVSHQILARNIPLDHLLVETDSPFLSPRHGRNEPSNVLDSVKLIARIRGVEPSVIAQATRENARRVFSLP